MTIITREKDTIQNVVVIFDFPNNQSSLLQNTKHDYRDPVENANFASRDSGSQSASKFTFTFKINITGSFNQIGFRGVF